MFTLLFVQLFYRVSQGYPGHRPCVFVEEGDQPATVDFAGCPQQPPGAFVHEVFVFLEQEIGDR